jgi:subtilisin family serine protease
VTVRPGPIGAEPEGTGDVHDRLEGTLDDHSGHGTFITGLVHQTCPDADILMVQVMESDGYVPEGDMVNAVLDLAILHRMGTHIDVLSMSFGYYHEAPDDVRTDASLGQALGALADAGTLLVASAGNDATTRRMFPAALDSRPDHKPLNVVAVGARNPNGTVALFSNDGDWVDCHERGASVLSTLPVTFDASLEPTARTTFPAGTVRETIDPDDFQGGFGVWSGTSFAAPIVAGRLAADLLDRWTRSTGPRGPRPLTSRQRVVAAVGKGAVAAAATATAAARTPSAAPATAKRATAKKATAKRATRKRAPRSGTA